MAPTASPRSAPARAPKQPTRPTAFVNARLIDPESGRDGPGGLLAQDGAIADCGPQIKKDAVGPDFEIVDCGGKCLAPGLVDMRVQLREPGEEHKETIASGSAAAAAGGVTSMVCLPNTDPVIDDVAGVEFIARRARENRRSKVYCYGAITRKLAGQELVEFGLLAESGALAFTDGLHAVADARVMLRALKYSTAFDVLMVQFPEEPALARNGAMNAGELATRLGLTGIAPQAEVMMIERDMHLVAMSGARYHVSSLSTAAAVEAVRTAKARGLNVTCDTAPHYFALDENEVGDYRTFAKVSPPLRRDTDRAAIAAAVADGTIDCVVSDHAPHDQDSKRVPFAQAASGVIGLETLLAVALELVHKNQIDMIGLFRRLALAPADLLRLPQGRLTKGAPADLVLFDPDAAWQVNPAKMKSKSKNSAFDERPVQGRVLKTVVDGRIVFDVG